MTTQVLVVDDVPAMAEQYAYDLKRVGKYDAIVAAGGEEALDHPGARADRLCRARSRDAGHRRFRGVAAVCSSAGSNARHRLHRRRQLRPLRPGCAAWCLWFVDKAEPIERVVQEIENAVSRGRMAKELRSLRSRFDGETSLIGDSAPMRALRAAIARVAPVPSSVLIVGESGSGKELVARELHRLGPGAKTPLVAVNSAALPEQLVESELFGHERGAFTGADRLRRGAFENGRQRNAVPRRSRRTAASGASQSAARARRPAGDAARRQPGH